jgi:hypothetical protein
MKKIAIVTASAGAGFLVHTDISAQGILKKLKNNASDVTNRVIDKKVDNALDNAVGIDGSSETSIRQRQVLLRAVQAAGAVNLQTK